MATVIVIGDVTLLPSAEVAVRVYVVVFDGEIWRLPLSGTTPMSPSIRRGQGYMEPTSAAGGLFSWVFLLHQNNLIGHFFDAGDSLPRSAGWAPL